MLDKTKAYANLYFTELCEEIVRWKDTGLLNDGEGGRLRAMARCIDLPFSDALGIAEGLVSRMALELCSRPTETIRQENVELKDDLTELQWLFDMQWKRDVEILNVWRAEDPTNRDLQMPDRGDLVKWLWEKLQAEKAAHHKSVDSPDVLAQAVRTIMRKPVPLLKPMINNPVDAIATKRIDQ